ncbi:MAG: HK97 family phage prohead protease [Deltaproteobacteria bacterium]|nr:HK97 family phage prohead protease [Deltaproteobacteria bacterium]
MPTPDDIRTRAASATLMPSTWDEKTRTLDVVISTGAVGIQRDLDSGERYEEALSVEAGAVDTTRLDAGAVPVLTDHGDPTMLGMGRPKPSVRSTIGRAVEGSLRYEQDQVGVSVRLTTADDAKPALQRILDGTLRTVSIGYKPLEVREEAAGPNGLRRETVTRYMLAEISFTPIPMDPGARARSMEDPMPAPADPTTTRTDPAPAAPVDVTAVTREARAAERRTQGTIRDLAQRAGVDLAETNTAPVAVAVRAALNDEVAEPDQRVQRVRDALLGDLIDRQRDNQIRGGRVEVVADEIDKRNRAIEDALCHRYGLIADLPEPARRFRGETIQDIVKASLGPDRCRGLMPDETARLFIRSAMSTADLPNVFANLANKSMVAERALLEEYNWYTKLFGRRDFVDYKVRTYVDVSGLGTLPLVKEGAEYTRAFVGDAKEESYCLKYGKEIAITEEMLVNNDIGDFLRAARRFLRAAVLTESSLAALAISANPTMGDGKVLFLAAAWPAGHQNLSVSGGAPNPTRIAELDAFCRNQIDLKRKASDPSVGVGQPMRFYLGGPHWRTVLEQYYSPAYVPDNTDPTTIPIVDLPKPNRLYVPHFTGTAYYGCTGDTTAAEFGYLQGTNGPRVTEYPEPRTDSLVYHGKDVFGVKWLDPRAIAMNPGA